MHEALLETGSLHTERATETERVIGGEVYVSSKGRGCLWLVSDAGGHLTGEAIEGVYVSSADLGPENDYDELAVFLAKTNAKYGDMLRRLAD